MEDEDYHQDDSGIIIPHLKRMVRKRVQLCQRDLYHGFLPERRGWGNCFYAVHGRPPFAAAWA